MTIHSQTPANPVGQHHISEEHTPILAKQDETGEARSALRKFFDIVKKIVDILDDVWSLLRSVLPRVIYNIVGPFLTAGVGIIIHFAEFYQACKEAIRASAAKLLPQRKTRLATSVFIMLCGATGAGISVALILGSVGLNVAGLILMTPLITGLLTLIYSAELVKRAYVFHVAKQAEDSHYQQYLKEQSTQETPRDEINAKALYQTYREHRLEAERKVVFGIIEVIASACVLLGTIVSTIGIFSAASVASFGLLPLGLLIAGVVLGIGSKIFDRLDEKRDFAWTRGMRAFFVGTWQGDQHGVGVDMKIVGTDAGLAVNPRFQDGASSVSKRQCASKAPVRPKFVGALPDGRGSVVSLGLMATDLAKPRRRDIAKPPTPPTSAAGPSRLDF